MLLCIQRPIKKTNISAYGVSDRRQPATEGAEIPFQTDMLVAGL
jgi:hypothetical protein